MAIFLKLVLLLASAILLQIVSEFLVLIIFNSIVATLTGDTRQIALHTRFAVRQTATAIGLQAYDFLPAVSNTRS